MMKPRISIIITSFNTRDLLFGCLKSIYGSRPEVNFEVIVVDNHSTDGTAPMLARDFPAARTIFNTENRRWSGGNNQGARIAAGDLLFFLNSDTVVQEGALDAITAFMDEHPETGLAGPRLHNPDGTLQRSCRSFPGVLNLFSEAFFLYQMFPRSRIFGRYYMTNFSHDRISEVDMVTGAAIMVRKTVFEAIGEFDEEFHFYGEETDYCYRAGKAGYHTCFFPGAVIVHHGGASPQQRQSYYLNLFNGLRRFMVKHFHGATLLVMIILQVAGVALRVPVYFLQGLLKADVELLRKSLYYLKLLF